TYQRDGFLVLPGLFDADAVERFDARFVALVEGQTPRGENLVIMRDVMVVEGAVKPETPLHAINKVLSFEDDEVLFGYARDAKLLAAVRSLIGPRVMTISTNVINKPPGIDGRHPLHQDLRYFALRPEDAILGTWTALTRVTRESGCLAVIPGSHRAGLIEHGRPDWEYVNAGFFAADGVDVEQRVHIEMDPGDVVLIHPLLVHGSGRNRSQGFRRAITTHFASRACSRPPGRRQRAPVIREIEDAPPDA
ncbi:MAG: phytanoyl-CoA dioxygenase family protein, partial [Myxococcota bacterium]